MNVFCITGGTKDQRLKHIAAEIVKRNIMPFNVRRLHRDPESASIGIRDIKQWWSGMTYTPTGNAISAGVIENAELLTTEAQNALLKPLEEPPLFMTIFLETPTTSTILPTILSRCCLIPIKTEQHHDEERSLFESVFLRLTDPTTRVGEKMAIIDREVPNKEKAKDMLIKFIEIAHQNGPKNDPIGYKTFIQKALTSLQELQSNVSYKLVLDAIFLPEIH